MMGRQSDGPGKKRVGEHHDGEFSVYMSHKIQKLRAQNDSIVSASLDGKVVDIFRGVCVYVDGYTVPSKEEIRRLMLLHGGTFEHYETNRVTHIIATHLPASKLLLLKKARKPLPLVHPNWIVRSIEQKQLLPVQQFQSKGFVDPTQCTISHLSGSNSLSSPLETNDSTFEVKNKLVHGIPSVLDATALTPKYDVNAIEADTGDEEEDSHGFSGEKNGLNALKDPFLVSPVLEECEKTSSAPDKLQTTSTRDGPEFVKHFFAKSRLHHIGTWRSTFQQKAAEFLAKYKGGQVTRALASSNDRVMLHVDMDCFFVAVAVRGRPQLEKVPVAVAHSGNAGSSEISSCNYLARAKGVGAGMFMQTAKELCPDLVVLPYQFDAIQRVSFQIYDIFFSHTPFVQAVSCDEAFLEFGKETDGMAMAKTIRQEIFEQTGCAASVGVSFNILLAKLSSQKAKPDGIYQVSDPDQAATFMLSLNIRDLPGAGVKTRAKLEALGVEDVRQLVSMTKGELVQSVGKAPGEMLYNYARGRDIRPLSMESNMMRKSVSAVVNFGIRFENWENATVFLSALGEELSHRLRNLKVRTQCVTLLIKKRAEGAPVEPSKFMGHGVCDNFSKSHVLAEATDDQVVIGKICIELLRRFNFLSEELRGVGVQATKLVSHTQSVNKRSGQLFKAWLTDSAQPPAILPSSHSPRVPTASEQVERERKTKDELEGNVNRNDFTATTFSQIDTGVLEELPEQLKREILASYGRGAPSRTVQTSHQLPPKRKTNGKAPLRRRHPARNIFDSKSNSRLARAVHASFEESKKVDALNDVRMSQVDSEVYYSLPFAIRNEIDRYAKKRKPTSMVIPRPNVPSDTSPKQVVNKKLAPVLPSIEDLYAKLVESLPGAVSNSESDDERPVDNNRARSAAFDAIYSRILIEVENRTLDQALRMLRFVRRKCLSTSTCADLTNVLKHGFNHILTLVNQDIRQHFNGVLSLRLVAPLE
ncbi:hypothetical protein DD238_004915 [Peronospora effusa]|uniref:DNA repair protein REV1 n=1 Tax=Peronospora effusa TaxID=542832 RepID=A0A3M6VGU4_9STRA|nr:hypothetical protein DD238_004915 [Peronospora effusa]